MMWQLLAQYFPKSSFLSGALDFLLSLWNSTENNMGTNVVMGELSLNCKEEERAISSNIEYEFEDYYTIQL